MPLHERRFSSSTNPFGDASAIIAEGRREEARSCARKLSTKGFSLPHLTLFRRTPREHAKHPPSCCENSPTEAPRWCGYPALIALARREGAKGQARKLSTKGFSLPHLARLAMRALSRAETAPAFLPKGFLAYCGLAVLSLSAKKTSLAVDFVPFRRRPRLVQAPRERGLSTRNPRLM
jgi:hypothetical protein